MSDDSPPNSALFMSGSSCTESQTQSTVLHVLYGTRTASGNTTPRRWRSSEIQIRSGIVFRRELRAGAPNLNIESREGEARLGM